MPRRLKINKKHKEIFIVKELLLFTDGSVNTQSKIGYGAYLAVKETGLSMDVLKKEMQVKRFEDTSSTKLELQTLLWALKEIKPIEKKVIIYTDSQNIVGLPGRRKRLEPNDYRSRKNIRIKNYKLYQEFYKITDQLDYEVVKVQGHQRSAQKDKIDKLFTIVDRASRKKLKAESKKLKVEGIAKYQEHMTLNTGVNPKPRTQNPEPPTPNSQLPIPNSELRTSNFELQTSNSQLVWFSYFRNSKI